MSDVCGTGGWSGPLPGDPDNNVSLMATPAFGGIDVSWTYPETNPEAVAYVDLYRGLSNVWEDAIFHHRVSGDFYYDKTSTATAIEYFYWIIIVSVHGTHGERIGPTSSTARPPIEDVMRGMTSKIDAGHLAQSLKEPIDQVDFNKSAITQERIDRISADDVLGDELNLVRFDLSSNEASITEEENSRISDVSGLAEQINQVVVSVDDANALIENETIARVDGDEALSQQINTVQATYNRTFRQSTKPDKEEQGPFNHGDFWVDTGNGNRLHQWETNSESPSWVETPDAGIATNAAIIQSEQEARADAEEAFASDIQTLQAETADNSAAITNESQVRSDENEATAERIDSVVAAAVNIFRQEIEPDPSNTLINTNDLWVNTDQDNRMYQWSGTQWLDTQDGSISAAFAAIQTEEDVRVTETSANASHIDTVESSVNDAHAAIQTEQTTRSDEVSALASDITQLEAETETNSAAITEESTTRADEDTALGSRIDTIVATSVSVFRSDIAPDPDNTTINTNDLWVNTSDGNRMYQWDGTQWLDTQDKDIAGAFASIQTEQEARIEKDSALASDITTLQSSVDGNAASIQTETETRIEEDNGLANQINTVESNLGDDVAQVQTNLNTEVERVDGEIINIGAQYTAQVNVNGVIGGFGIYNDGTEVQAGFDVDAFWVGRTDTDGIKPFIIDSDSGETFIKEAVIYSLTIEKLRSASGDLAFTPAEYDSNGNVIEESKLRAKNIDADNLTLDYGNIKNVDVQSADINNAAITNAKIDDAAVSTLKIGRQEVTFTAHKYTPGRVTIGSSWTTVIDLPTDTMYEPVNILYSHVLSHWDTWDSFKDGRTDYSIRVILNGNIERDLFAGLTFSEWYSGSYGYNSTIVYGMQSTFQFQFNVPYGITSVSIQMRRNNGNQIPKVEERSMTITELKR